MSQEPSVFIQPTPNPNALKFILNEPVKSKGKSTYENPSECGDNALAMALFTLKGIDQLHFFGNSITVSKFNYIDWEEIEERVIKTIQAKYPEHNPDYEEVDPEEERRKNLPPELLKIEEILDKTIRPGLQGDGGDLKCLTLDENVLVVQYEGACGTCPSSTTGTLSAIRQILKDEYHPDIEVYAAPSEPTYGGNQFF